MKKKGQELKKEFKNDSGVIRVLVNIIVFVFGVGIIYFILTKFVCPMIVH